MIVIPILWVQNFCKFLSGRCITLQNSKRENEVNMYTIIDPSIDLLAFVLVLYQKKINASMVGGLVPMTL